VSQEISEFVDARVGPRGSLENLSQSEIDKLLDTGQGGLYPLFRRCALAVLNSGAPTDSAKEALDRYRDFDVRIVRHPWGVKLEMQNAPAAAFVDGQMIRGIKEHLFAVLRDVVFISNEIIASGRFDLNDSAAITNAVFHVLRNARLLDYKARPNLVVCWGGHSIDAEEYQYTKKVGYEMGLRHLDVCTGCGPGAMKGPMKGATIGHAKQRIEHGRYIGITEPGIIAAEPPNAIVSQLAIMPDIEKRLEAFVRLGHGIVVFPGGAGTAEEILYLAAILQDPANQDQPFPVVLTGPRASAAYFEQISRFVAGTLGPQALQRFSVIMDDPPEVARRMVRGMDAVREFRRKKSDSYNFNWLLSIPPPFQRPFEVTHASMRALDLRRDQPLHELAANLRRAFSGIVTGNVKDYGIQAIERDGPYELSGDPAIMRLLDELLAAFVAQRRMRLPGSVYKPVYRLVA
jgi:pyrimidine/purine-5'-nucleotide nucleosidase